MLISQNSACPSNMFSHFTCHWFSHAKRSDSVAASSRIMLHFQSPDFYAEMIFICTIFCYWISYHNVSVLYSLLPSNRHAHSEYHLYGGNVSFIEHICILQLQNTCLHTTFCYRKHVDVEMEYMSFGWMQVYLLSTRLSQVEASNISLMFVTVHGLSLARIIICNTPAIHRIFYVLTFSCSKVSLPWFYKHPAPVGGWWIHYVCATYAVSRTAQKIIETHLPPKIPTKDPRGAL